MILLIGGSCSERSDRTADNKVRRTRTVSSRLDRVANRTVEEEVPECESWFCFPGAACKSVGRFRKLERAERAADQIEHRCHGIGQSRLLARVGSKHPQIQRQDRENPSLTIRSDQDYISDNSQSVMRGLVEDIPCEGTKLTGIRTAFMPLAASHWKSLSVIHVSQWRSKTSFA